MIDFSPTVGGRYHVTDEAPPMGGRYRIKGHFEKETTPDDRHLDLNFSLMV